MSETSENDDQLIVDTDGNVQMYVCLAGRVPVPRSFAERLMRSDSGDHRVENSPIIPVSVQIEDAETHERYELELILDSARQG